MKKIAILSILVVASIALVAGVALANYGKDNKLSGYVKVKGTLMPLKGTKVKLYTTGGTKKDSDTTSLKGKYSFSDLHEQKYVVRATASGYHDPNNAKKNTVSATVKVDGSKSKNLYFAK